MIELAIVALFIFCTVKIISAIISKANQKKRQAEIERIKAEQIRQQNELRKQKAYSYEQAKRQAEYEREQKRIKREQEALRKEQEKQSEILRKHEDQIAKLNYKVEQAEKDIVGITEELGKMYALLDIAQNQQIMAVPGSRADESAQKKILSYEKAIRAAEKKLDKAKFDKEMAERKLSA